MIVNYDHKTFTVQATTYKDTELITDLKRFIVQAPAPGPMLLNIFVHNVRIFRNKLECLLE
jgi:hypothetical protein